MGKNDDEERMWNLLMFNFYGTDKEMSRSGWVIAVVAMIAIGLAFLLC